MWKEFFNFNKRERITLTALTLLILLSQLALWTMDEWVRFLPHSLQERYRQRATLIAQHDSVSSVPKNIASTPAKTYFHSDEPVVRKPFNPNTADSMTLLRLGLRSYVVKNLLQYRRKGGTFQKPTDLAKIYGMKPEDFSAIQPFIRLDETPVAVPSKTYPEARITSASEQKPIPDTLRTERSVLLSFELNAADTTLLQQLKGVGSFTASKVVRYRNQLGGFYSIKQLAEIKGLYPETIQRLQSMLTLDPNRIVRIDANKASLEKLRAHPYLSFYQAKVIVELRKARGRIPSIEALKTFQEFTDEDLERLKWYLSF